MVSSRLRLILPVFLFLPAMIAHAQWSSDPAVNNAICLAPNYQNTPKIISDTKGGAIIVWYDERAAQSSFDIYAQRIDRNGYVRWTVNGLLVCGAFNSQVRPDIAPDGEGGAIIVWSDTRNGDNDIYGQRIDSTGKLLWAAEGVPIAIGAKNQADPRIVSDGKHGVIVTWNASTGSKPDSHIYAQRVDANGTLRWGQEVAVSTAGIQQNAPCIASDGNGGAFIAWAHMRISQYDTYAQRLDSSGVAKWANNGVPVGNGNGSQNGVAIMDDGAGNAFVAFSDFGTGSIGILKVVVLKRNGTSASTTRMATTTGSQENYQLVKMGVGRLGIVWDDGRVANRRRVFAQVIDTTGTISWTANGVAVSDRGGDQVYPAVTLDGSGGMIVVWGDKTAGDLQTDIYGQRISGTGALQWPAGGVPVSTATNVQQYPQLVSDGQNGAVITWEDYRPSLSNSEVYASRLLGDGSFPIGPPLMTFSSKAITFGAVVVGSNATKTITLSNTGGEVVNIASISSSDPQFSLTPDNNTVAPGAQVTATARFQPSSKGIKSAYFVIQSNSVHAPDTVTVTGTGNAAPAIRTDKSTLDFGDVKTGSSKALALKISNPGNDTLSISNITTSNTKFTVAITSRVLAPGGSFDDTVRFSPTAVAPLSANLTITSNAATSPTLVTLSGKGVAEVTMTVAPAAISYGEVVVGTPKDTTVTITNTGNDTLRISSFTSGDARFSVVTPITGIPPAGVKNFTLRCAPDAAGPLNTVFTVTSNTAGSPITIAVDAIGVINPTIAHTPAQLQFGSVGVGRTKDLVLTITNTGSKKLVVSNITSSLNDFTPLVRQFEVQGGGSYNDTIRFAPALLGPRSGVLTIVSNASTSPNTIAMDGTGTDVSAVPELRGVPGVFALHQNYPNPFRPSTTLRYDMEITAPVRVTVVNTLGQVVATLVDETQHPGAHIAKWTAADAPAGVYYYVLRVGVHAASGTMVLMK